MTEALTFPYDPEAEGSQGLIESSPEQDSLMFPETPAVTTPTNIEEVVSQAAIVESSHSGKDFETQKQDTQAAITTVGIDEVRRSIAEKEKTVELGVAEQQLKRLTSMDTASYYQEVLNKHNGPPQKHAMEKAVVDIVTPKTWGEFYIARNNKENVKDLAARNIFYEAMGQNQEAGTFWDKALTLGRELVGFVNSRGISSAIAEALDRKATFSGWVNPTAAIEDFRTAYSLAPADKRVELVQALIHGLERTSSFFGDKNASQVALNLHRVLEQTPGESQDIAILDILGLPLITMGKTLVKGVQVAAELGKPANVAIKAGNTSLAVDMMAKDAIQGSKISGMSTEEIAREAFSMGKTPMELSLTNLKVSQPLLERLKSVAEGLRTKIADTLMPSSITPAQVGRAGEYFEKVFDTARNKAIYEYTPTPSGKEGWFTGTVKWQSKEGMPFRSEEAALAYGKEEGKVGVPEQVGRIWGAHQSPKVNIISAEDKTHKVFALNGDSVSVGLELRVTDEAYIVQKSEIGKEFRGKGIGFSLYQKAVDEALNLGKVFVSDSSISASALKVYKRLEQRGYDVRFSPLKEGKQRADGQKQFTTADSGIPAVEIQGKLPADEVPSKVGAAKRVYATGGTQDVTGKIVGGTFPEPPADTATKFFLYGATKQDKQGRFYREIQEYAAPGQEWVFKENFTAPLPNEAIGIHTLADVSSRNILNAWIPSLASSEVTVTQRGLSKSAQAKIAKDLTAEYNAATKGLSFAQSRLVDKALFDGDALSNAAGAVGYVFDAVELGARGLSDKAIESYYRMRILRDTGWLLRGQEMLREYKAKGLVELAFDGNAFAQALHAPVKPMLVGNVKSLATQGKIGKVFNIVDGKVINLAGDDGAKLIDALYSGGGMVVGLHQPQIMGGRKISHIIINPNDTKLREISMPLPYRPGELARGYTDEYFVFMKRDVLNEVDSLEPIRTRTVRTAPSKKKAEEFANAHNEAIDVAFKTDLTDAKKLVILEQIIGKYTDAKAFLQDTKTGKILPDEKFGVHYNREKHSYLEDAIDESVSSGRMFTSLRGEKLLSVNPERVNTLDVRQSLGVELANISRYITSQDIRITAMEKWHNTFGHGIVDPTFNKAADFLHPLDAGKLKRGLIEMKEKGQLSHMEDLTQIDELELLAFAERERSYIQHQLNVRTDFQKKNTERYKKFTEWVQGTASKVLPEKVTDWMGITMRQMEVTDFLRQANFHMTLGGGNLAQLIVQAQGAAVSMGVHPQYALQSAKTAVLMRIALMSDNPNVWKGVGFFDSLSSLGLKNVNEFADSVRAIRDSGILADIRSTALYNAQDGALDLFKHYAPTNLIKNALVAPFNRGEEFARLTSWEVARRVWVKEHPGEAWNTAKGLRDISSRQKEFNLGMQAHNTAPWQQGLAGIPMQFLQYNVKLAVANLHTLLQYGKAIDKHGWKAVYNFDNGNYRMFNPAQAAALLATQVLLYGAAGNGLRGLANEIWGEDRSLSEEQKMYIAEGLAGGIIYSLTQMMDGDPAKLALGKRLGTFEWYGQIWDKIVGNDTSGGTATTLLMGPTKSSVDKVFGHVINLYQLFVINPEIPSADAVLDVVRKWPEVFSGFNNAQKFYTYWQNEGIVTSKDGTPLAKINKKEVLAALLGMPTEAVAEFYENVKDSKKLYNLLNDRAKEIHKIQIRRWDASNSGNTELADELAKLQDVLMGNDMAHKVYILNQLRTKLWPGDTASDKIKREFNEKMDSSKFRVLDK